MKEPKHEPAQDPLQAARRLTARPRQKRFYATAEAVAGQGGFALQLDGRAAITPSRNPLVVPDARIAHAIVAEWEAQGAEIDPASMPATRLANSAIDGVAARMDEVRKEILGYAGTDLVYYRAGDPERLVARQHEAWDPVVTWAERRFGARLILAEGMTHVAQSEKAMSAIRDALAAIDDPFRLAGLHLATTLAGSALIALALAEGTLDVDQAWATAHVDEDFNISQWGEDADAARHRARRFEDFRAAGLALAPD